MQNKVEVSSTEKKSLDEIISGEKSLVIFVRHLGWPVYKKFLTQLRDQYERIAEKGVKVIAIAPSSYDFIQEFLREFGPFPFPIYGDPKRKLYKEMGHVTMPKWKLLGKAFLAFISGKVKDFIPKDKSKKEFVLKSMKTQDVYIQGGIWLYSADGKLLWSHKDDSPERHAKVSEIIKQIEATQ